MPCYSYDDIICHVNYLYDKSNCLGILAFQHFHPYMSDENISTVRSVSSSVLMNMVICFHL